MYLTLYDLDRLAHAALDAAGSGMQPYAPWLYRARGAGSPLRRARRRRAGALRPRPALTARPAADGCR